MTRSLNKYSLLAIKTVLIILITLGVTEAGFRLYHEVHPVSVFKDAGLRWRGIPYGPKFDIKRNSRGFADREYPLERVPGLYRMVAIGDSFVDGMLPYKYNFLTLLEDKLNQGEKKFEVINMGVTSTNPSDYYSLLVNESLDYSPDLAMVFFFIGNDFQDSRKKIYEYSYVYMLAKYIAVLWKVPWAIELETKRRAKGPSVYDDNAPSFDEDVFLDLEKRHSVMYMKANRKFADRVENAFSYLKKMAEVCESKNIEYLVVVIPAEAQIDLKLQSQVAQINRMTADEFDFTLPNKLLHARLEEAGIKYLDLLEPLGRESKTKRVYQLRNAHWNIAGNEFASEVLREYLEKNLDIK